MQKKPKWSKTQVPKKGTLRDLVGALQEVEKVLVAQKKLYAGELDVLGRGVADLKEGVDAG
jgi:hypothetical protein